MPLYFQLAEILKERIEAGMWPVGTRFPSERELGEEFRISRTVIRPALDLLESDGQLVRIKGRGTFVTPPKAPCRICGLARLLSGAPRHDIDVRVLSTAEQRPEPDVREALELPDDDSTVVQVTAVVLSAGAPVCMSNSFLVAPRIPDVTAVLRSTGARSNASPANVAASPEFAPAHATIATAFVSEWEATQLEVSSGDPCFLIRYLERIRDRGRVEPIEFARIVYRSDVLELEADLA